MRKFFWEKITLKYVYNQCISVKQMLRFWQIFIYGNVQYTNSQQLHNKPKGD